MDAKQLPARPSLEQYRKQAKELLRARTTPEGICRFKRSHPRLTNITEADIANADLSLADAQWVIAREHAFESWPKFSEHIQALLRDGSTVSRFELAADAIVTGDLSSLKRLLREDPGLVRARSTRAHQAPLLHYVAANGVEDFRQKTPGNIVEVTRTLLEVGAEVDATTQAYGGASTALGLAATSYHPAKAGVQLDLLQALLDAGARVDGAPGGWNSVVAALHNGRGDAAAFLADRGALLNLESAAGTGHIDVVARYIDEHGSPKVGATQEQLHYGFLWACEYGHAEVVEFLLARGVKPEPHFMHGATGLHWAALSGQLKIVELLLKANAPIDAKEQGYGGTPLGWAVYGWDNPAPELKNAQHHAVVERLIRAGATVDWEWIKSPNRGPSFAARLQADTRMMAALSSGRGASG